VNGESLPKPVRFCALDFGWGNLTVFN